MIKNNAQLFIGAAMGIIFIIAVYFLLQYVQHQSSKKDDLQTISKGGIKIDTVEAGNYKIEIKQDNEVKVKLQNQLIEEKIKSFNDRIGDMYLSMTIIIALLLSIVAGVYFKTEAEVAKHMNKYYGKYKTEIEEMYAEAQTILDRMRSKAELAEQILPKQEANQSIQGTE